MEMIPKRMSAFLTPSNSDPESISIRRPGNLLISTGSVFLAADYQTPFRPCDRQAKAHWSVENISRQGRYLNHLPRTCKYGGLRYVP